MPALARILVILLTAVSAAGAPALNQEWLELDRQAARELLRWAAESGLADGKWDPAKGRSFWVGRSEQRDLGFGASRLFLQKPGGHSYAEAEIVTFQDRIIKYRLRSNIGSDPHAKVIRDAVATIWREGGNSKFELEKWSVSREVAFPDAFAAFREAVARELGPVAPHKAGRFTSGYADLLSPFEQLRSRGLVASRCCHRRPVR